MDYTTAVETILDKNVVMDVATFLIGAMALIILVAKAVEAVKKLFVHKPDDVFRQHCEDAEARFRSGEKHIAENHDHISDLKDGQRVMCVAIMALLNHELHNGNADEMNNASTALNNYLINRK